MAKGSSHNISTHLSMVEAVTTAHGVGMKKVLLRKGESVSNLTQIAYGSLNPHEHVETHRHPDMEEFFFFLAGRGVYYVDGENVELEKGVFVRIPANTEHFMKCTGPETLEFFSSVLPFENLRSLCSSFPSNGTALMQ